MIQVGSVVEIDGTIWQVISSTPSHAICRHMEMTSKYHFVVLGDKYHLLW